jgi:hypothetical protein
MMQCIWDHFLTLKYSYYFQVIPYHYLTNKYDTVFLLEYVRCFSM